jgi:hypothetical protein
MIPLRRRGEKQELESRMWSWRRAAVTIGMKAGTRITCGGGTLLPPHHVWLCHGFKEHNTFSVVKKRLPGSGEKIRKILRHTQRHTLS